MAQFDWQTEDDDAMWDEPEVERPSPPPRRRRWWPWLGLLTLAGVAGVIIAWQINRQANTALAAVEADVLSTHNLVVTAAADRDADLLRALLSGRDMGWVGVQEDLTTAGLLLNRTPLDMALLPESHEVVETEIAPDLESAELTFHQSFAVTDGDGQTQTVTLAETAVYRRGSQRWLMAPPEDDFWGEWDTIASTRLMLVFPVRDEPTARRLFPVLDDLLIRICTQLADISCDDETQLIVRLEKDPETLLDLASPRATLNAGLRLSLPTPSLVGLPLDDAGFEALLRGYGVQVATAVIAHETQYRCCEQLVIYQSLLDYQLGQLGLRHWPITLADHEALWEEEMLLSLDDLINVWQQESLQAVTADESRQTNAAIDFLLYEFPDQSPASLQRLLARERLSFSGWLRQVAQTEQLESVFSVTGLISELDSRWRLYPLLLRSASAGEAPLPLPAQDLYLMCAAGSETTSMLHRYDSTQETWTLLEEMEGISLLYPLADDETALQLLIQFDADSFRQQRVSSRITRWQDHAPQVLVDDGRYLITLGQLSPDGRYLAVYPLNISEAESEAAGPRTILLDLMDCDADGCAEHEVPGIPVWSPDGEQAIFTESFFFATAVALPDGRFWLLDNDPQAATGLLYRSAATPPIAKSQALVVGSGYAPFWVDDETYGYVQLLDEADTNVVVANVGEDEVRTLVSSDDLLAAMPVAERPFAMRISYVVPHPLDRSQLFILGTGRDGQGHLFLMDSETGEISYRLLLGYLSTHTLGFSPDGRYLATTSVRQEADLGGRGASFLAIHDIPANHTEEFLLGSSAAFPAFLFDWSNDGNWLALLLDQNLVQLIAPAENYREILPHTFGECASVNWMQP